MEINPQIDIEDLAGEPIEETKVTTFCHKCNTELTINNIGQIVAPTGKKVKLRNLCVNALSDNYKDADGMERLRRGKLAEKIYTSKGKIDLESEDISLLKDLIGKKYDPVFVHRAYELLDPTSDGEEEDKPAPKKKRKKDK